jgi:hypothetical protein
MREGRGKHWLWGQFVVIPPKATRGMVGLLASANFAEAGEAVSAMFLAVHMVWVSLSAMVGWY